MPHHTNRRTTRLLSLVALLALLLAACGENNQVGDESILDFESQVNAQDCDRLGADCTTTTAPPATPPPADGPTKAAIEEPATTAPTTAPPTTAPPTTKQNITVAEVRINSDSSSSSQFDPPVLRVYVGTVVKWINNDEVPRSVESDDARTFATPLIQPGQSFSYKADTPGRFPYHDGTRPYAVAQLEVLAR